jgi:hypothetical protein
MYGKRKGEGAFDIQSTCLPMKSHHHFCKDITSTVFTCQSQLTSESNFKPRTESTACDGCPVHIVSSYSAKIIKRNTLADLAVEKCTGAPQPSPRLLEMNEQHLAHSMLRLPYYLAKPLS